MTRKTDVVDAKFMANRYHITLVHFYRTFESHPDWFPPTLQLPGSRRLRWRLDIVERWEIEHTVDGAKTTTGKRRGRPLKAEEIAKRAVVGQA